MTSFERDYPDVSPYRILEQLGQGATAEVFRAADPRSGREVVLKLLFEAVPEVHRKRFAREIRSLCALSHPCIVRVLDSGCSGERPWYAMELLPRRPLDQVLQARRQARPIPIEVEEARQVLSDLGAALEYAHGKQIVHRDLKPSNILVDESFHATLIDFGIVKLLSGDATKLTATGDFMGTPLYAAPEQVRTVSADARSDLYSFGLLAYELLTGRLPFAESSGLEMMRRRAFESPPPASTLNPLVPAGLDRVILHCLEPKPEARYQTMSQVLADLATAFAGGRPAALVSSARRPAASSATLSRGGAVAADGGPAGVERRNGSRPGVVILAVGLVLCVAGAGVAWTHLRRGDGAPAAGDSTRAGGKRLSDLTVSARATSATVAFRTAEPAMAWLRYAPAGGAEVERIVTSTLQSEHSAELQNLVPETEYSYRLILRTASGQRLTTREQTFRTRPGP